MLRKRLVLRSRRSRPVSEVVVGDSTGRYCYLIATTHPAHIAVELEEDQVVELVAALTAWRAELHADEQPFGRPFSPERSAHRPAV